MSGPGQYLADPTAGITRPEELPPARIIRRSRNFQHRSCPACGKRCYRHDTCTRVLHDVEEGGVAVLSGVGFLPKEEQSRHSRAGGNPDIPQYTGQSAWMPACAGKTDWKPSVRKIRENCGQREKPTLQRVGKGGWPLIRALLDSTLSPQHLSVTRSVHIPSRGALAPRRNPRWFQSCRGDLQVYTSVRHRGTQTCPLTTRAGFLLQTASLPL